MKLVVIYALVLAGMLTACGKPEKGERGSDGAVGAIGSPGADGAVGTPGQNGADGAQGTPGVDATPVTIVKLCPGTTAYPGVYVEVALCLNSKLYGVYSANGGFLSEFPPGNYYSDGIGSACNLKVLANCVVQPL